MLSFLKYLLSALMVAVVFLAVSWLVVSRLTGLELFSVQTDSMTPTLRRGDLIVDVKIQPKLLKAGQVVSYYNSQNSGQIITHRVVRVNQQLGFLVTQGDNLPQADNAIPFSAVAGRTIKVIPKAGYLFDRLHQPQGLIIFVYIPALLISLTEVGLLASSYKYRPYQLG